MIGTRYLLIMCMSPILFACNSIPKKEVEQNQLDVYIFADENINPNLLNDPSPVKVNLIQLTTEMEFNQMNELSPNGKYKTHLGESVIDEVGFMIRPKQHIDFKLKISEKADYLGVVGAYRNLNTNWKLSFYKQDKKWYQKGGEYLYLDLKAEGIQQITKEEAIEKILAENLEKTGQELMKLTEKEKEKMKNNIEKLMENKKKADLKKGIYIQTTESENVQEAGVKS